MTADATHIEREIKRRDFGLFASDEPMVASATSILTRRVKQGVAEWYVSDLNEKSLRGMEQSVLQGWHTGGPPLRLATRRASAPQPAQGARRQEKHRLIPDPISAPIVRTVFEDCCLSKKGPGEICDKLNEDPDHYPPPKRNHKEDAAPPRPVGVEPHPDPQATRHTRATSWRNGHGTTASRRMVAPLRKRQSESGSRLRSPR